MILHEFLPLFVGQPMVDDILRRGRASTGPGRRSSPSSSRAPPTASATSMVRPSYRANLAGDNGGQPFFGLIFDPKARASRPRRPARRRPRAAAVHRLADVLRFRRGRCRYRGVRPNKLIDTKISTPLFHLPLGAIAAATRPPPLPQRNLLRHVTWRLPSGQSIARIMRGARARHARLCASCAATAWASMSRRRSGTTSSRRPRSWRVAGAWVQSAAASSARSSSGCCSSIAARTCGSPAGGRRCRREAAVTGEFRMVDFLTFAGVDPASRGQ